MVDTYAQYDDREKDFNAKQKAEMEALEDGMKDLMKDFMQRQSDYLYDFEFEQRESLTKIVHRVRSSFTKEPGPNPLELSESKFSLKDPEAAPGRSSLAHMESMKRWVATASHTASWDTAQSRKQPVSAIGPHTESLSDHDSSLLVSNDDRLSPIKGGESQKGEQQYAVTQSPRPHQPRLSAGVSSATNQLSYAQALNSRPSGPGASSQEHHVGRVRGPGSPVFGTP